jgi:tetratricopeptide (TPR) repeat protein
MKIPSILFLFILFYFLNIKVQAQYNKDSLEKIWKNNSLVDSVRLKALSEIAGNVYLFSNPDTSFLYSDTLEIYAKKVNNNKQIANALNLKGISFVIRGNYFLAIEYFNESLKISEQLKDNNGIANTTNSLGIIYQKQGDYKKSIEYFTRCLEIKEAMKDTVGMANALGNIGIAQYKLGMKDDALVSYLKSIDYRKQIKDMVGIANSYANIGNLYKDNDKMDLALESYFKSLDLYRQCNNLFGMGAMYVNISKVYLFLNNIDLALSYADSGNVIAEKTGIIQILSESTDLLYKIYKEKGDYQKALRYYESSIQIKDSLNNDENKKMLLQKQFEFEYERKEAKILEEKRQQKMISFFISILSIFIALILFLVYRNLKQTKKQKSLIESQKTTLEEKQKEILDSIHYAKRIQTALLTSEYYIDKNLKRLSNENFKNT